MANGTIDLGLLPAPGVIEDFRYETIVARQRDVFKDVWRAIRLANPDVGLPDYEVSFLETDPAAIGNQAESYRETVLRARINEAVRANLLAFARGSDLDHLAAFYDVTRLGDEDDDRLVTRVILAIQGRSPGGTAARYQSVAMAADIRVKDVVVYTVGRSPLIKVAVYSTDPTGVASPELVAKVSTALHASTVRMVNDTIEVASAVRQVIDLDADVWLLPDADAETLARAADNLASAWEAARNLGRDLTMSWWTAQLMIAGVHRVVPTTVGDFIAEPSAALSIGTINLTNKGRAY